MVIVKNPTKPSEGSTVARVSYSAGGSFGVVGSSEIAGALVFAPRGIAYLPCIGDNLLLMPVEGADTCVGALTSTSGLNPGELRLFSSGGASILLDISGNITLNGVVITKAGKIVGG